MMIEATSGIVIVGKLAHDEKSKPVPKKDGTMFQTRTLAINVGALQNLLVDVPLNFKIEKDKNDYIVLPVQATSKSWDNNAKQFKFNQVKFYIPEK